jgi:hypothetical protein
MATRIDKDFVMPEGRTEMSMAEYEQLLEQQRTKRREEARAKAAAEEKARRDYEEALPRRSSLPYNESLAQEICERVSAGELLITICEELHMPTVRRCNQWMKENNDFNTIFKESINDRLNIFEEQVIQIADDMTRDFKEVIRGGKTIKVVDAEVIARAKLRVDVRFKHLKAGKPQKWGETSTLITKTDGEDPSELSIEELERRLADIDTKNRILKSV